MTLIYNFENAKDIGPEILGNKAFNLLKMYPRYNIPRGLIFSSEISSCLDKSSIAAIESDLEKEIKKFETNYFSVRSSSTNEDSSRGSFAGQYRTYCGVSKSNILEYVRKVLNSNKSCQVESYRGAKGISREGNMAVLVQEMIACERSGVMFTMDPVKKNKNKLIIEAIKGLGEYIVSGMVTPDHFVYDKFSREVKTIRGTQNKMLVFQNGSIKENEVKLNEELCLTNPHIVCLANIGCEIENIFKTPQDIEWGLVGDKVYILQSRNITNI